ncbi:type II toxin-antitoxin system VapC family toxin [Inquilinus sp. NPDC058860]|uniref:type II toxin-antitoxin system VapC family toxin n=1 Tax=Inquilinus sp. NPDC058860 TaxID=3346652 RepID=UPI0036A1C40E
MTAAVLDASAVLALLLQEPGGDRVKKMLADAAMTTVNQAEVIGHLARNGMAEAKARQALELLSFERVPFDEDLAYTTGLLLPLTRSAGLSLGDRACLALAKQLGVPAMTADRPWQDIAGAVGVTIDLIR